MRNALARCGSAIVTGNTSICRRAVIKDRDQPIGGDVTGITSRSRRNVSCRYSSGNDAIVTRSATSCYLRMIHQRVHRCPRDAVVTGLAHIGSGDMSCTFTGSDGAIMTRRAHALHLRVVNGGNRHPRRSGMTGVTEIGC